MTLVNETHQEVSYWINCDAVEPNCGDIPVRWRSQNCPTMTTKLT